MKAVWMSLLLSLLLASLAAGALTVRLWQEWQRSQSWVERDTQRAHREEQRQEALHWWRENAEGYQALRRTDESRGADRQTLWQLLEPRARERRWADLRLKVLPAPPREPGLARWRRHRYQLIAELPHDGDAQWLWQTVNDYYAVRADWRRCRFERLHKSIERGTSHLSMQCRVDLWQWRAKEGTT